MVIEHIRYSADSIDECLDKVNDYILLHDIERNDIIKFDVNTSSSNVIIDFYYYKETRFY